MRFQTSEILETRDAEMVLNVLERSLGEVSGEVVREGEQITLRGLGPSLRTMNRNDITTLSVNTENGRTVIHADVTYQASALLGGVSQDEIVSSKLERVFDRVRSELGTKRVRPAASVMPAPELPVMAEPIRVAAPPVKMANEAEASVAGTAAAEDVPLTREIEIRPEIAVAPETSVAPETAAAPEISVAAETAIKPVEVAPEKAVAGGESAGGEKVPMGRIAAAAARASAAEVVTDTGTPEPEIALRSGRGSVTAGPAKEIPEVRIFEAHRAKKPDSGGRWGLAVAAACSVVAIIIYLAWPSLMSLVYRERASSSGQAQVQTVSPSPAVATPEPAAKHSALIHDEPDPELWLNGWVDAMQRDDATAQASFYADPVDRYLLKSNVSNANVWLDKQTAIDSRGGTWAVKVENIMVEPLPDSTVRVRLVKHITSKTPGGRTSEQFIRSQLKLKRIDGQWKITSEQNLR